MRHVFTAVGLLAACIATSAVTATLVSGRVANADGNAATDGIARVFPYSGRIELDGVPFNGELTVQLSLYDGAATETPAFRETHNVMVYDGNFQVLLGSVVAGLGDVIDNADDFYVGITIVGAAGAPFETPIALAGRQRVLPVPYALWAPEAADFQVNRDLFVARNVDITGSTTLRGATTTSGAASFTSTLSATGAATLSGGATVGNPGLTVNANSNLNGNTIINGTLTSFAFSAAGDVTVGTGRTGAALTFANAGESRINFPANAFGGIGDFAEIVYTRQGVTGEDTTLAISTGNDAFDDIVFFQAGADRLRIRSGNVTVSNDLVASGNSHSSCAWTGFSCQPLCANGRFVAGIRTHGSPNEDCWGGGDYDEPSRSLYCCEL